MFVCANLRGLLFVDQDFQHDLLVLCRVNQDALQVAKHVAQVKQLSVFQSFSILKPIEVKSIKQFKANALCLKANVLQDA